MKRSAHMDIRPLDDLHEQAPIHSPARTVRQLLTIAAIVLVVLTILVAESRLPQELRLALFEATYVYP